MSFPLPSEQVAVLATIDPDVSTAAAYTSDWIAVENWHQIMAIVMAGTLGTNATVDAKLQEATDGSGTGAQNITGKAITQLTEAGTDSDKQAIINLNTDEVTTGYTHVALVVTVGTATSDAGAIVLGLNPRWGPASASDLATVDEIVT